MEIIKIGRVELNVRELKAICDELLISIDDVINEAENEKLEKI